MKKISIFNRRRLCRISIDPKIKHIMDQWVEDKGWTENLNFDQVAARLGVRKMQISLYTHSVYGLSFPGWRKELRIKEAMRLLLEDKSIPTTLIGEAVGISDKSNFRRQFKEIAGCTPLEWRRSKH